MKNGYAILNILLLAVWSFAGHAEAQTTRSAVTLLSRMNRLQNRVTNQISRLSQTQMNQLVEQTRTLPDSDGDGVADAIELAEGTDICVPDTGTVVVTVPAAGSNAGVGTVFNPDLTATPFDNFARATATGAEATGTTTSGTTTSLTGATTATVTGPITELAERSFSVGGQVFLLSPNTIFLDRNGVLTNLSDVFVGDCAAVRAFQPRESAEQFFLATQIRNIDCATNDAVTQTLVGNALAGTTAGLTTGQTAAATGTGGNLSNLLGARTNRGSASASTRPGGSSVGGIF